MSESVKVQIYDTTLRDGSQGDQITLSAKDKSRIAYKLDDFGVSFIEGGWPGSNPKDLHFFEMMKKAEFKNARLVAFGSTRFANLPVEEDAGVQALIESGVDTVTIFGKSWEIHASRILGVSLEENLSMIYETVDFLKRKGLTVIYDAEHFFDGYRHNRAYCLKTLESAVSAGSDVVVLCDTNGGTMPWDLERIFNETAADLEVPLGIHAHNDCGFALANTFAAVRCGASLVQGTINGYGERCGNVDLVSVIGNLQAKLGYLCVPPESIRYLTELSRFVSEVANVAPLNQQPFVGKSAFAHKGGIHVSAIQKDPTAYEHLAPEIVGNRRRVLVSDLSGKSNISYKARELDIKLGGNGFDSSRIVSEIKRLEEGGYQFDAAEGSLALLMKKVTGQFEEPFVLESFRVTTEKNRSGPGSCHATIKISVGEDQEITAAEGDGPVNALDNALRKALTKFYPEIEEMGLVDFKVRVIDGESGTASKVRVRIESRDPREIWSTIGVSENVIEASWQALVDSIQYKLSRERNSMKKPNPTQIQEEETIAAHSRSRGFLRRALK
jgi:2-isopropylmalate synthase